MALNIKEYFENAATLFGMLFLLPFTLGLTAIHANHVNVDSHDPVSTWVFLISNICVGSIFISNQIYILTKPFSSVLPRYRMVAILSTTLVGVVFNGLMIYITIALMPALWISCVPSLVQKFIFGIGIFALSWLFPASAYSFVWMIGLTLSGSFIHHFTLLSNSHFDAAFGCLALLAVMYRLKNPKFLSSLVGKPIPSSGWDKQSVERARREKEKNALKGHKKISFLERAMERGLIRSKGSSPAVRLATGLFYCVMSRTTTKKVLEILYVPMIVFIYSLASHHGSLIKGQRYVVVISVMVSVFFLFGVEPYFHRLPESRQNRWLALVAWAGVMAIVSALVAFSCVYLICIAGGLKELSVAYLVNYFQSIAGCSALPFFAVPLSVALEIWIESSILRTLLMVLFIVCGLLILPAQLYFRSLILVAEWIVLIVVLKMHTLKSDFLGNERRSLFS